MDYPIWQIPQMSGGLLIAVIAVVHVFVAHFAVGGGLFLVLAERKGIREDSPAILEYVKKHTKFFLLLTMVFGSLTGVAIWFIIAILNPAATLVLIHTFTFGWAIEWVFFLGEITALLVYFYTFGKMNNRDHQFVGWMYFLFGWLSLFMINGIIGFMLTPGGWVESGDFWQGFFNPSFWPSLCFRSFLAFMIAGLFCFVTAVRIKAPEARERMVRYGALWVGIPLVLMVVCGIWYLKALPQAQQSMIALKSSEIPPFMQGFWILSACLLAGALVLALLRPGFIRRPLVWLVLLLGLMHMGSFEWIREAGRRPYVIWNYMYSNAVPVSRVESINETGMLAAARWVANKEVTDGNKLAAGKELFDIQCLPCHSVGGPMLDILPRTEKFTVFGLDSQLDGQGKLREYMPPFFGTPGERNALAAYVVKDLQGKQDVVRVYDPPQLEAEVPPFDPDADEYLLLAWPSRGMHFMTDADDRFSLVPPGTDLRAMLLLRSPLPELASGDAAVVRYELEPGFDVPPGEMSLDEETSTFAAKIPATPYTKDGTFRPYPLATVQALDENGGVLAETRAAAPVSTEMGCNNCHGGGWRVDNAAGITEATAGDILAVHDRINKTDLAANPQACQACHADPLLDAEGDGKRLNLSAAIHGFHANYLTGRGAEACDTCHPTSDTGATGAFRGRHAAMGMDCTGCHGAMEDHAISLLKQEQATGKERASLLMNHLEPQTAASTDEINPRTPWLMEPDCTGCHDFAGNREFDAAFNQWTDGDPASLFRNRRDDMGTVPCAACHGAPHAIYPALNMYGDGRDNIGPLQYQGEAGTMGTNNGCPACHGEEMDYFAHHELPGQ